MTMTPFGTTAVNIHIQLKNLSKKAKQYSNNFDSRQGYLTMALSAASLTSVFFTPTLPTFTSDIIMLYKNFPICLQLQIHTSPTQTYQTVKEWQLHLLEICNSKTKNWNLSVKRQHSYSLCDSRRPFVSVA